MRRAFLFFAATVTVFHGCATVTTIQKNEDRVVERRSRLEGPGGPTLWRHEIVAHGGGKTVVRVTRSKTCTRYEEETLERVVHSENSISPMQSILKVAAGVALLGAGAGVLHDAPKVPRRDDMKTDNPVGREGAYAIGVGALVAGTGSLVLAIVDLLRARDTAEAPTMIRQTVVGSEQNTRCNEEPGVAETIWLVASGGKEHRLGATNPSGAIEFDWASLPEDWFVGPENVSTARLALKRSSGSAAEPIHGATISLTGAANLHRAVLQERASRRLAGIKAGLATAMRAGDLDQARSLLAEWKSFDVTCDGCRAFADQLAEIEVKNHLRDLWKTVDSGDQQDAARALEEVSRLTPDDPRLRRVKRPQAVVPKRKVASAAPEAPPVSTGPAGPRILRLSRDQAYRALKRAGLSPLPPVSDELSTDDRSGKPTPSIVHIAKTGVGAYPLRLVCLSGNPQDLDSIEVILPVKDSAVKTVRLIRVLTGESLVTDAPDSLPEGTRRLVNAAKAGGSPTAVVFTILLAGTIAREEMTAQVHRSEKVTMPFSSIRLNSLAKVDGTIGVIFRLREPPAD